MGKFEWVPCFAKKKKKDIELFCADNDCQIL